MKPKTKPNWQNIFNTSHKLWFEFHLAHKAALDAGYGYFSWEGNIHYTNSGQKTGLKLEDIK
jgi:hypothetical protein